MSELSWRSFVDYVVARKNVENCMIVSAEDASHWASNSDFMVSVSPEPRHASILQGTSIFSLVYIPESTSQHLYLLHSHIHIFSSRSTSVWSFKRTGLSAKKRLMRQ